MKAMISQPMANRSDEEIKDTRERAISTLTEKGYELVNTLFEDDWADPENMKEAGIVHIPVAYLARSIEEMSKCDAVYFCKGWDNARGCRIEYEVAKSYGLTVILEEYTRCLHPERR